MNKRKLKAPARPFPKTATGIRGLDEITLGGLPRGRPTLVCGGAGSGKTLIGIEFLVRGATEYDEPGVCLSFEETTEELTANVASIGFDLNDLIARKKLSIDHIYTERSQIEEAGDYDLEGLFVRLSQAVDSIKAKRVMLDSIEAIFASFGKEAILRAELRRLFRWLKDRKLTAIVTAERGDRSLTRYGIEEYISDCVILLDNRVNEAVSTRRLRVVKYRGSTHGTNEYPFLVDTDGISVLPVTSLELNQEAPVKRISTGLRDLDSMLGGGGYFRGSSILVSGTAGTGKTTLASHFVDAACARGERCVMFSFEESPAQIIRNMRSIGIDLKRWVGQGLLHFHAVRPSTFGLEMHLVKMHKIIAEVKPDIVVADPVTALLYAGSNAETRSMLLRLVDFLKTQQITALLTTLSNASEPNEQTQVEVSSVVDTWILLRDIESGGERNRGLYVLKARGLAHSNQIREYVITGRGLTFREVYLGADGLLTGSARMAQEAKDAYDVVLANDEIKSKRAALQRRSKILEAQIAGLRLELETQDHELQQLAMQDERRLKQVAEYRTAITKNRAGQPVTGNTRKLVKSGGGRRR
jgi:circadian clock protein KaiC